MSGGPTPFRLSRIYADGWNAARASSTTRQDELTPEMIAALNPHRVEAERLRWSEGFRDALAKSLTDAVRTTP